MPSTETIIVVALSGLLLSLSPGPSMVYVLSRTLAQGRWAGFASAFGLALGGVLLAIGAALGLTSILRVSDAAYQVIRWVGAIYLVYLGGRSIFESMSGSDEEIATRELPVSSAWPRVVIQGVFVELFNPKTILFFLAFVPQFVNPVRGDVVWQMLILGALVPLTAIPSDIVVSIAGGAAIRHVRTNRRLATALELSGGLFLVGIGIHLFITG